MPGKHDEFIKSMARIVGAASVPASFAPGADSALLLTHWTTMLVKIAKDHNEVTKEKIGSLLGSLTAAIIAYKTGGTILSVVAGVIIVAMSGGLAFFLGTSAAVLANAVLNAYYTYKLGHTFDDYFSNHRTFDVDELLSLLRQIVVPNVSEIKDFWHDCNLSFSEIKKWL